MPHFLPQPPDRSNGNVVAFPVPHQRRPQLEPRPGGEWRALTRALVLDKASRGELPPALMEYLLDAAGVAP